MSAQRTPKPSPLAGEGAERRRREAGEGVLEKYPSPGRSLRSRPPSPARGEGTESTASAKASAAPVNRARALRTRMTDAERKLWFAFRDRRFADFKFRRQVPIGPFVADFACYASRVIIEVDGGQHADSKTDAQRDRWFVANNFHVLRYWNNDVLRNLEGVLISILAELQKEIAR